MTAAIDSAKKTAAQRHRRAVTESFVLSAYSAVYFAKVTAKGAKYAEGDEEIGLLWEPLLNPLRSQRT